MENFQFIPTLHIIWIFCILSGHFPKYPEILQQIMSLLQKLSGFAKTFRSALLTRWRGFSDSALPVRRPPLLRHLAPTRPCAAHLYKAGASRALRWKHWQLHWHCCRERGRSLSSIYKKIVPAHPSRVETSAAADHVPHQLLHLQHCEKVVGQSSHSPRG